MLETLKQTGKTITSEIGRTWDDLRDGWREIYSRSRGALTHYIHPDDKAPAGGTPDQLFPAWGLLAGEVEETEQEIVVRLEVPGMEKEDCQIRIEGNVLYLSGEKRFERASLGSAYHVMERAYGAFQRAIPLPRNVLEDKAEASYRNGVLTVRLPKSAESRPRSIPVT